MKLIVGLGNPGERYAETYHNLGFITVDKLAAKLKIKFSLKASMKCMLASGKIGGEKFLVAKPLTYMNLSGESVKAIAAYYKIDSKDMIVVYDDLDIEAGELRFRERGSAGTHNGMRNIVDVLATEDFPRLRIGSKKDNDRMETIDYVLSVIPKDRAPLFVKSTDDAADFLEEYLNGKTFDYLMQKYNGKR